MDDLRRATLAVVTVVFSLSPPLAAAELRTRVDLSAIDYPSLDLVAGRIRLFGSFEAEMGERWFVRASAYADGATGNDGRPTTGIVRPHETYIERRGERVELRFGFSNVAWGVLDELAPSDVINPVDISRFVLENRAEARLPVPLARVRWFLPAEMTLEALLVPWARPGTFDQLDEPSSPFAPQGLGQLPKTELPVTPANMEGGARLRGVARGLDWSVSVYRDVVDFDRFELSSAGLNAIRPARIMLAGDIEVARGNWVFRSEGAYFHGEALQAENEPFVTTGWSFHGGFGLDRPVGANTVFLDVLYRAYPDDPRPTPEDEVSLVGGLTRELASGTQNIRFFGLWNAQAGSSFARAIWNMEIVENLQFEVGGGVFLGEDRAFLAPLADSDFVVARLRVYF